jgi:hypothetical protein
MRSWYLVEIHLVMLFHVELFRDPYQVETFRHSFAVRHLIRLSDQSMRSE